MSRFELPPQYDPHAVERPLYGRWLERGVFTARADSPKPPYVIVIPPPNVTAVLHMGQGLNNVTQDVLIRFERMRGREALWLPGTDHAGIATQNVVERLIAKEGKTRFDLGREAFVARVWAFVRETGPTILEQLKMIGASCDWTRTRFTFDPAYSRAVREVFVTLWEEGLIYRGHRVIHWCPRCLTALSDEEAESRDIDGKLYYIRYPVEGGPAPSVTVATTRPETLLGDTAVAVNPTDKRHRAFVGKVARLPIIDLPVPIIADDAVEPGFGTGFVKVTPAHDATDFEIGLRHKLEMPLVMTEDGRMEHPTRVPKTLADLDRFVAREKIVDLFEQAPFLEQVHDLIFARRPRPLRRAGEDRGPAQGTGPARKGRAAPARGAPLLSLRLSGGAAAVRSVVRENKAARGAGARSVPERGHSSRPRAVGRDVRALDGEHPGVEHLAAAVVGSPHPRVHLHQVRPPVGRPGGPAGLPQVRRPGRAGSGRTRHLVLVLAVALRDARLARPDARLEAVLSRSHAGDGPRDPVLLGGAHDHGRLPLPRRAPVLNGLPARHRAGYPAPQDVQIARQRHRPARRRPVVRRRRAALDGHRRPVPRVRPDSRSQRPRDDVRAGL